MSGRPTWDDYFLAGTAWVATRATCPKRSVGAVIVKDRRIVATGYNGAPPGAAHCSDAGCIERDGHCVRANHAEWNAILHTAVRSDLAGATIYVHGGTPCYACARAIVAAGIARVVCRGTYHDPEALALLNAVMEVVEVGEIE